jgi:hypothetical protein
MAATLARPTTPTGDLIRPHRNEPSRFKRGLLTAAIVLGFSVVTVCTFALSFGSLRAFALAIGFARDIDWMFPVALDGSAILGTVGFVYLTNLRSQGAKLARSLFALGWVIVIGSAAMSILCNGLHAALMRDQIAFPLGLAFVGSAVPPLLVAGQIHLIAGLLKPVEWLDDAPGADLAPAPEPTASPEPVPAAPAAAPVSVAVTPTEPTEAVETTETVEAAPVSAPVATVGDAPQPDETTDTAVIHLRDERDEDEVEDHDGEQQARDAAIAMRTEGIPVRKIVEEVGYSQATVYRWLKEHRQHPEAATG